MNLKEILVPIDFTDCSMRALETAKPLARQLGAKIVLLHVVDVANVLPMGPASDYQHYLEQLRLEAQEKFGQLIAGLTGQGVVFETVLVEGLSHESILEFSQKRNIGIIVLGKRKGKFWQIFRRHTAEAVQKRASCLVRVIRESQPEVSSE